LNYEDFTQKTREAMYIIIGSTIN